MTVDVVVIFGGANSEHEVSCRSAEGIVRHLDRGHYRPVLFGIDRSGGWHRVTDVAELAVVSGVGAMTPDLTGTDVAFPALHGRFGEDGSVQGMLEMAGIPYVGCGVLSSALAMDKAMALRIASASGIRTPDTFSATESTRPVAFEWARRGGFPVFVKPNRAGSSVGATRVVEPDDLHSALDAAFAEDRVALIQAMQTGDEVDIGVLQGPDGTLTVGAPLRVRPADPTRFFDFEAKYAQGGVEFEVPAAIPAEVSARLAAAARTAFEALGCDGLARVDFFVNGTSIVLNEVNTMPGMTARSQFPRIWAASGMAYSDVLDTLLRRALVADR